MRRILPLAMALCVLPILFVAADTKPADNSPRSVRPFTLKDTAGKDWSFKDEQAKKAIVVVFIGTQCPINNAYMPRLAELHKEYAPRGVAFVAINANSTDKPARVAAHAKDHGIPFPILKDTANIVADRFAARRTPEAFVLDGAGKILYQGRIDDQIGVGFRRPAPTRRDLAAALDEVLAGKTVSQPRTQATGCAIARTIKPKADGPVTYSKHVAPILQKNCQECHRPGQVGPMSLLTYEDALGWAETIEEVVRERRMPPWHADAKFGHFANDRSLAPEDRDTLLAWIKQDCPKGDPRDLPPPRRFPDGWSIGKPDVVVSMPEEFNVPAKGGKKGISYKYFHVETKFDEDRWIQAAEARPGNRAVVHHIIVYVLKPGESYGARGIDGIGNNLLVAFAPANCRPCSRRARPRNFPKAARSSFRCTTRPTASSRRIVRRSV